MNCRMRIWQSRSNQTQSPEAETLRRQKGKAGIIRTASHETGHTGGLNHPEHTANPEKKSWLPGYDRDGNYLDIDNLMLMGNSGTKVIPGQRTKINNEIHKDTQQN